MLVSVGPTTLLLALSLVPLWTAWNQHTRLNDDTYITLTYAKNLAAGRGFVYNHPPATLGTTTPLLTLVLAGLGALFPHVDLSLIAVVFTTLCWIGILWVFYLFRRTWNISDSQALIIALLLVSDGWIAFLGMEAYLFAFLLVLSFSLWHARFVFAAGLMTGLLFLTRGEGVLIYIILSWMLLYQALVGARTRRGQSWFSGMSRLSAGFALPVVTWSIYAYQTFGHVLPNTLAAKRAQGQDKELAFLHRLVSEWMPCWGARFQIMGFSLKGLWWVLLVLGVVVILIGRRRWLVFIGWTLAYILGYTVLRVSPYWWYQFPVHFVAQIMVAWGLGYLLKTISSFHSWKHSALHTVLPLAVAGAASCVMLIPAIKAPLRYDGDARAESYLGLSRWIRDNTDPQDSVAYAEIGYIGYYTPNRIVDLLGLVMPDVVPYVVEDSIDEAFWRFMPDYYIYTPGLDWLLSDINQSPRFGQLYRPVTDLPGPHGSVLTVFKCTHSLCR
ncbi:MAG: hypothetical protein ACP5HS_03810 [Anaerolineae bacterium]